MDKTLDCGSKNGGSIPPGRTTQEVRSRSLMDRTSASGAGNACSIHAESTT